jgi:hypothetical protein
MITPEQQRIEIAKLVGWSNLHIAENGTALMGWWHGEPRQSLVVPDYVNDSNAIREALKLLSNDDAKIGSRWRFIDELIYITMAESRLIHREIFELVNASPQQCAQAFLRAFEIV